MAVRVTEEWYQGALFRLKGKARPVGKPKPVVLGPEDHLAEQLSVAEIPFERQFRFHPVRKWRADFRMTGTRLLVEVEGGTWMKIQQEDGTWVSGAHNSGPGFERDIYKYTAAMLRGYTVLRVTSRHVRDGSAITWIRALIPMHTIP